MVKMMVMGEGEDGDGKGDGDAGDGEGDDGAHLIIGKPWQAVRDATKHRENERSKPWQIYFTSSYHYTSIYSTERITKYRALKASIGPWLLASILMVHLNWANISNKWRDGKLNSMGKCKINLNINFTFFTSLIDFTYFHKFYLLFIVNHHTYLATCFGYSGSKVVIIIVIIYHHCHHRISSSSSSPSSPAYIIIILIKLHVWVFRVERSHIPVATELFTRWEVRARPIRENLEETPAGDKS